MEKRITQGKKIYVTHMVRRPAQDTSWVPLAFITQIDGDNDYYQGYEFRLPKTPEEIGKGVLEDALVPLEKKVQTTKKKSLWLNPDGKIYLTDKTNPIEDSNKQLIVTI